MSHLSLQMRLQCRILMRNWGVISQVNSDISEVDSKVPEFVMGTYTGDGTVNRTIELGFTPRALLVVNNYGTTFAYLSGVPQFCGGFVTQDSPAKYSGNIIVEITENGFIVNYFVSGGIYLASNSNNVVYHYIALK